MMSALLSVTAFTSCTTNDHAKVAKVEAAESSAGFLLPIVFAIATALPVLVVAWVLAYSMQSIGKVMGKIAVFQKWFNRIVAILFIGVGIYYSILMFS